MKHRPWVAILSLAAVLSVLVPIARADSVTTLVDGTAVLLFHPEWDMLQVGIHYAETCNWQNPCGDLLRTPTHWMALPSPPPRQEAALPPVS